MIKISIITPSYNQGEFIARTLQSVAIQQASLPKDVLVEHIVCDGGSTDNTIKVLDTFYPPVRWISEQDKGQAHAVNKGIAMADGDIIGWLNSDDVYYPGAFATVVQFFKTHPEIDVVYGMADHIDTIDQPFETYPTEAWNLSRLEQICFICQPALFFRRRVFLNHGLLDESLMYCMDYEYWLRLGKSGVKFVYLTEKLAGSRLYLEAKTLRYRVNVHGEINKMLKKHYGVVPEIWLRHYAYVVMEASAYPKKGYKAIFIFVLSYLKAAWQWNKNIWPALQWGKAYFRRRMKCI